jgi:hypothetical protein
LPKSIPGIGQKKMKVLTEKDKRRIRREREEAAKKFKERNTKDDDDGLSEVYPHQSLR